MTIKYLGQSEYNKEDRFAVIDAKASEEDLIIDILAEIAKTHEYRYDICGDDVDICVMIPVDDKEEFKMFASWFRDIRKEFKFRSIA